MIPLRNKTGTEVASALQNVFKERKPEKLGVDKGKEFYNKHVQQLVELYSTENEEKSDKGYTPNWTEEVFTVSEVHYTDPITYKLKDLNGEEIKGSFYEQ